ncbi:MAG: hypothetical protein IJM18_03175 [Clostridia bacterium]|nr:hypothetical protein [Clostridia bacterium]
MHTNGNTRGVDTDRFFTNGTSERSGSETGCGSNRSGSSCEGCSEQSGSNRFAGQSSGAGSRQWNTEASSAPIDTTDLTIIQDEMHSEALLYKKCTVYADYFTDPRLKNVARTAAEHHKAHFDRLNGYLNSSR